MVSPSSQEQYAQSVRANALHQLLSIGRIALWFFLTVPGVLLFALFVPTYGSTLALFWPLAMMLVVALVSYIGKPLVAFALSQQYLTKVKTVVPSDCRTYRSVSFP